MYKHITTAKGYKNQITRSHKKGRHRCKIRKRPKYLSYNSPYWPQTKSKNNYKTYQSKYHLVTLGNGSEVTPLQLTMTQKPPHHKDDKTKD